jgi:nucleotide-binding universal stress UspA family protein
MLKKILVPLDGSELAERALGFATALSIPTAAHLVLVRAVTTHPLPGTDAAGRQMHALAEAEAYLGQVAAGLAARGFVVETATPYGERPAEWILEEADIRKVDVIAMTTHGRTGPGRWLFGSVAEEVVSRAPIPVLLHRAWDSKQRQLLLEDRPRLLVPLDTSTFAEMALQVGAALADDLGGELVLVSVETTAPDRATGPSVNLNEYLQGVGSALEERWPQLVSSSLVEFGDPAVGIAAAAERTRAALVVMATHGRTGIARAALGSVSGQVLEHGSTPLLLVHPSPGPTQPS